MFYIFFDCFRRSLVWCRSLATSWAYNYWRMGLLWAVTFVLALACSVFSCWNRGIVIRWSHTIYPIYWCDWEAPWKYLVWFLRMRITLPHFNLAWRNQPLPVTIFEISFWEWRENPAAGLTRPWTLLDQFSESRRAIGVRKILSWSERFAYSWSLLRKIRNRVVHVMNGNLISWKQTTKKTKWKSKGFWWFAGNLIAGFFLIILALWIVRLTWLSRFIFRPLNSRDRLIFRDSLFFRVSVLACLILFYFSGR